jgi:hypothetical protein
LILDCLLENLQNPLSQHSKMVFQKPLETFADILQVSCNILHQTQLVHSADPVSKESDETMEQRIAGMILYIHFIIIVLIFELIST